MTEVGADVGAALAAARALAPGAERLVVVAYPPRRTLSRPKGAAKSAPQPPLVAWLDSLRAAAAAVAASADVGILDDPDPEKLDALVDACLADLVVAGPLPAAAMSVLADLRRRRGVAVLWVPAAAPGGDRPLGDVLCVALGVPARGAMAAFLRDHCGPDVNVRVLSVPGLSQDELASGLDVAGIRAPVALAARPGVPPWRALDDAVRGRAIDLVVLAHFASPVIRSARWPVLVLPPAAAPRRPATRPLDVGDAVDLGEVVRVRVGSAYGVGRNAPIVDQEVALVSGGRLVATVRTRGGEAELPSPLAGDAIGVFRVAAGAVAEPVAQVERLVAVVRPGSRPLVLFDAELPVAELRALAGARDADLLAVRMRPARSVQRVRVRLREAGLDARVADAGAVLAEGDASDVGDSLDAVRLARVATRMSAAGFPVVAIVHRGPVSPSARGFEVLRADEVGRRAWKRPERPRRPASLAERLDAMTGVSRIAGNRVEVELDNERARRWLLDAIARSERTLHLQTYMAADDELGREVEAALGEAAGRGVTVRVLADSLHGCHGSLGMRNPLLERVSAIPGVELRVAWPVLGLPSLEDLKLRDHRKLVVADGRVALLGGRNLGQEYYRGFGEVAVAPTTPWREVPWLDAGARVEGPAVAALERSFLQAWTAAGGAPFGVVEPAPAGPTQARPVVHHALRDAAALEAYVAMIETARSSVDVVTGFPLVLEIQHALLRALARGVRVRTLFGHVAPTHDGEPFEGEWAAARTAATLLVHSRIDALVAASADAYDLEIRDVPGWAPGLGPVHPHVHAKAMSADGRVCAVGSANLDLTGSYWESELMLVVEDEPVARAFEDRVRSLMARSVRVDRDDPAWQRLARRREWMRHWPGVLSL
ncbi:MAG TPA: phosphatidylserine/phosphatidylglycerophosphate/cardiolipin synthase family protein [Anaeromyxobacter sp.]